jgi:ferric-dicitrate binding protein FerR (iron transport regulator)
MTEPRKPVTEEQVTRVYRSLADDFARECARVSADRTWRRLEHKLQERSRRPWSERVRQRFAQRASSLHRAWPLQEWRPVHAWSRLAGATLSPKLVRGLGFAVAATLIFGLGTFSWLHRTSELSYEIVGGKTEGGWVLSKETPVLLEFSDGSELQMQADSLVSVNVTGRRSALTRLSKGDLRVEVQHADRTDWRFFAGPFEVRVVGTKFDMSWREDRLSVGMREGTVRIIGPEREWTLRAGERLETAAPHTLTSSTPKADVAAAPLVEPQPLLPPEERGQPVAADEDAPEGAGNSVVSSTTGGSESSARTFDEASGSDVRHVRNQPKAPGAAGNVKVSWNQLLAKGEFEALVSDAREVGIDTAIQTRSSDELAALAHAARYARDLNLSRKVWIGLRQRFAGAKAARDASFYLARIDEQAGQFSSALELYAGYLQAVGYGGAYAPEALGRRLVILRRTNPSAAVDTARNYLVQFPSGAYAKLARDTVISEK